MKPHTAATIAAVPAYGICVRTWSIRSAADPMEDMIVVSEIGEQWSPKIAPHVTAAIVRTA